MTQAENSEVSPAPLVAVAVTIWPAAAANSGMVALPLRVGRHGHRTEERLPFAVLREVAGGVAEELDRERAHSACCSSVPCTPPSTPPAPGSSGDRSDRVAVARVVRGDAVGAQIDAQDHRC